MLGFNSPNLRGMGRGEKTSRTHASYFSHNSKMSSNLFEPSKKLEVTTHFQESQKNIELLEQVMKNIKKQEADVKLKMAKEMRANGIALIQAAKVFLS